MKLLSASQMQALDQQAIHEGAIPGLQLMETAGLALTARIEEHFSECAPGPLVILAGRGNNGGDGFVVARALLDQGWQVVTLVLAENDQVGGDARVNLDRLLAMQGVVRFCPDALTLLAEVKALPQPALVLDALLGTGLTSDVRGVFEDAIDWINQQTCPVVAVDIPSGVHGTSGRVLGTAVHADLTVTFAAYKPGLWTCPGAEYAGRCERVDIGIPKRFSDTAGGDYWLTDPGLVQPLLPVRQQTAHKGAAGHLLVAAGSRGKTGAAVLAAEAGLRAGAGLVSLACPESVWDPIMARVTEVMTEGVSDCNGTFSVAAWEAVEPLCQGKSALVYGPGVGRSEGVDSLVRQFLHRARVPLVIDADGLNSLADQVESLQDRRNEHLVLTPHPGEMARLTGLNVDEVQADRLEVARAFAKCHGLVLVLKGARTVVAAPDGRCWINSSGNPALATAGTGDVLCGMIGGLIAQGIPPVDAAVAGVFLHGAAADVLKSMLGDAGMIASDLLTEIPRVRTRLIKGDLDGDYSF